MTTAQEILKLIESVDPADTAKLDEIDARVVCYVNEWKYSQLHLDDYRQSKIENPEYHLQHYPNYIYPQP